MMDLTKLSDAAKAVLHAMRLGTELRYYTVLARRGRGGWRLGARGLRAATVQNLRRWGLIVFTTRRRSVLWDAYCLTTEGREASERLDADKECYGVTLHAHTIVGGDMHRIEVVKHPISGRGRWGGGSRVYLTGEYATHTAAVADAKKYVRKNLKPVRVMVLA